MSTSTLLPRSYHCDDEGNCYNTTNTTVIIVIIVIVLILKICFWIAVCTWIKRRRARRARSHVPYHGGWNQNPQELNPMPGNVNGLGPTYNGEMPPPEYYGQGYARNAQGAPEVKGATANAAHVV